MKIRIAAVAVAALAAIAFPSLAEAKVTKLTVTEVIEESEPPAPGALVAGHGKLLKGTKTIGRIDYIGAITEAPLIEFFATLTLPGGKLTIADVGDLTAKTQVYAIVGGTGRYAGARGTDRETRIGEGMTRDVLTIIT